ncbi:hypothetical protein DMN91_005284, partial [Ooceraea biroi]
MSVVPPVGRGNRFNPYGKRVGKTIRGGSNGTSGIPVMGNKKKSPVVRKIETDKKDLNKLRVPTSVKSEELVQKKPTVSSAQEDLDESRGSEKEDMDVVDSNLVLEMSQELDVDAQTLDRLQGFDIQQLNKQKDSNVKIKLKISAEHAASNKDKRLFSCKGVIADWPYDIPELWKNMVDKDKDDIIKIERMKRRIWDKQTNKYISQFSETNILLWNAGGIRSKKEELLHAISPYDIVVITETKVCCDSIIYFPGYKTYKSDNLNNSGGVAILIKHGIEFEIIKDIKVQSYNFDVIGIRVVNTTRVFNLIAVYRKPYGRENIATWNELLDFSEVEEDTIILGDFNAHHTTWNCDSTDKNGERLFSAMYDQGFSVLNSDFKSRLNYYNQVASNIDLVFVNNNLPGLLEYNQLPDTWGSDHYPIEILLDIEVGPYKKLTNRVTNRNTDWSRYCYEVEGNIISLRERWNDFDVGAINDRYNAFIDCLRKAAQIATGKKDNNSDARISGHRKSSRHKTRQPVQWWDAECAAVIQDRKAKLQTWKRSQRMEDFIEFKRARAIAKRTIKSKKKEDLDRFCNSINRYTDMSYVWNTMRVFKRVQTKINWNKWQLKDRTMEIRNTIDTLAPPWVAEDRKRCIYQSDHCHEDIDNPFSLEELDRALQMIRKDSAPGLDGVDYSMLKKLPILGKHILLDIFNSVWSSGFFPDDWRKYQVIFIDKAGKDKVRSIALSSCVDKLMERMVNERLIWWLEFNNKLDPMQNGFRRGRSCMENLAKVVSDVRSANLAGEYSLAAFLDVSSAYDNVVFDILAEKLRAEKCPTSMYHFIDKWLDSRTTTFVINNSETEV